MASSFQDSSRLADNRGKAVFGFPVVLQLLSADPSRSVGVYQVAQSGFRLRVRRSGIEPLGGFRPRLRRKSKWNPL